MYISNGHSDYFNSAGMVTILFCGATSLNFLTNCNYGEGRKKMLQNEELIRMGLSQLNIFLVNEELR